MNELYLECFLKLQMEFIVKRVKEVYGEEDKLNEFNRVLENKSNWWRIGEYAKTNLKT